jgi:hypothetical protein
VLFWEMLDMPNVNIPPKTIIIIYLAIINTPISNF